MITPPKTAEIFDPPDNWPAEYADDALALMFTQKHGKDLRFTAALGRWSIWNGSVWKQDETLNVFDLARKVCRDNSGLCDEDRVARRIASAATVAAVERLARADRQHAATVEQWDADPWLLNTPGGVVDLRTGKLRAAEPADYMTKITVATPGGECPLWRSFLAQITDGDAELQAFLQRMAGYALTGSTREHALFFLHGTGANGKSVFLNTIARVMGSYAMTAPVETFIESKNERHPTDLAGLRGARLVTAIETEDGRRWAESKLKTLTGGDSISARLMRQDFFQFTPQFKLIIAGNHKPGLRNVDEAMRRRFNLLPFSVTVPAAERDLELPEKLCKEWGGILQWMIEGCLAWQAKSLSRPAVVSEATEDYLAAEDSLARWLEDRCAMGVNHREPISALWSDWQQWAKTHDEACGSQKRFSENVEARGFKKFRTNITRGFQGIRLRNEAMTDVTGNNVIHVTLARANGV